MRGTLRESAGESQQPLDGIMEKAKRRPGVRICHGGLNRLIVAEGYRVKNPRGTLWALLEGSWRSSGRRMWVLHGVRLAEQFSRDPTAS